MKVFRLEGSPITYYMDDTASNDWVVFLHAAFVDHRMFRRQFRYFSGKYNLLAVDILGHGNSDRAQKGDRIEKMSIWIARILEKHKIPAAHFVGVSLGGVLIQDFANRYSGKVLSLSCFGAYDINRFDPEKQKSNSKEQMKMMFKALVSIRWFANANKKISACTEGAQEEFYRLNVEFRKSSLRYLAGLDRLVNSCPETQRQYPLLVGCGAHDIPAEIEIVNEWAAREHCDPVILADAGHCVNMDNPQEFHRCLEQFWERSRGNTSASV